MNNGGCFVYALYRRTHDGLMLPNSAYLDEDHARKVLEESNKDCPLDLEWHIKSIWIPHKESYCDKDN